MAAPVFARFLSATTASMADLQYRRLSQIQLASVIGLSADLLGTLLIGDITNPAIPFLAICDLIIATLFLLGRRLAAQDSSAILLWSLTLCLSLVMWRNDGLRDAAVLAFPGILLFAAMLGSRRQFLGLLVFMLAVFATVGIADIFGWRTSTHVPPINPVALVDFSVVLLVIGFSVRLMADDMRRAYDQLQLETQHVNASQAEVEYIAHHDALTNLPNRRLAEDRFSQAVIHAERNQTLVAMLFLDLDHFKTINDTHGHQMGDQLLVAVAKRLNAALRASDTICRHGGDEFLIILEDIPNQEALATLAAKVLESLAAPLLVNGRVLQSTCSLGIAIAPIDGSDFDTVLKKADLAMYRAKENGRNAFLFYDEQMNQTMQKQMQLINGLRDALDTKQIELYYQPKLDINTNQIIGAEALLRWRHPLLGQISPVEFIPVAESTGAILTIGKWALEEACRQCAAWRDEGYPNLVVAVNLSPVQFRRDDLVQSVRDALSRANLAPHQLELELTESLLIDDNSSVKEQVQALRALGVSFALDDFGTGYSNLGYLHRFSLSVLKIDRSFVLSMLSSPHDRAIVQTILQLARNLKLQVVAEGVEDEQTRDQLAAMGCQLAQGYLWSPALPSDKFIDYLSQAQSDTTRQPAHG